MTKIPDAVTAKSPSMFITEHSETSAPQTSPIPMRAELTYARSATANARTPAPWERHISSVSRSHPSSTSPDAKSDNDSRAAFENRNERANLDAIALLQSWASNATDDGRQADTLSSIKKHLDENRASQRKLFSRE